MNPDERKLSAASPVGRALVGKREGDDVQRWNLLHPDKKPKCSHVEQCLEKTDGPVIAATDYVKLFSEQIRGFVPRRYVALGTDGFGRSDTRKALRRHFEVDRYHVALAALHALAAEKSIPAKTVKEAMRKYQIDPEKPNPLFA